MLRPTVVILQQLLVASLLVQEYGGDDADGGSTSVNQAGNSAYDSPVARVTQRILDEYGSSSVRPGVWKGRLTNGTLEYATDDVFVQYGVQMFENLDQLKQLWGMHGYFRSWWHDPRLAFNSTEAQTSAIYLSYEQMSMVWQPILYIEDCIEWSDVKQTDGLAESFVIYEDGSVWRSQQRYVSIVCALDLAYMPFDTQTCTLLMGMYTELAHEVHLRWRDGVEALDGWRESCPSSWFPTRQASKNLISSWPSGDYSYAHVDIDFTRSSARTMLMRYLVSAVALVALSYLGFFINPAATPARVALGVICILAVLGNAANLSATVPDGSTDSWLATVLFASFVFNLVAFLEQVYYVSSGRTASVPPHCSALCRPHCCTTCCLYAASG
jgi:hypothetical protein